MDPFWSTIRVSVQGERGASQEFALRYEEIPGRIKEVRGERMER